MPEPTAKRWTIRSDSPTTSELRDLRSTIKSVAPKADKAARDAAMSKLEEAIYQFRLHYPYKSDTLKGRGKAAQERDSLAVLSKALRAASKAAKALPLNAQKAFRRKAGVCIAAFLDQWSQIAHVEYRTAKSKNDRPVDDARSVLALDVARTLEQTLQSKVSMSSDRNATSFARGGAGYCRLLRSTLQAAGADPSTDLAPLMREGKALLAELPPENDE